MNSEGSSFFHLEATSPGKSCLGENGFSELNVTPPCKSPYTENDTGVGLLDRPIDSTMICESEDLGEIRLSNQIIPSGLESLVSTREMTGNASWTSSMATPLSKNITFSLNTEERQVFLPSDDCSSTVKRRALFTPDVDEVLQNDGAETPKAQRSTNANFGRTLLDYQEENSLPSHLGSFSSYTPMKNDSENQEPSSKRKLTETVSPIVSKKRLKMQRNRNRNKVVGSPEPSSSKLLDEAPESPVSPVDMFEDSTADLFSDFENASSTPSRKGGSYGESTPSTSRSSFSMDKNSSAQKLGSGSASALDLEKTLVETKPVPKPEWSPDDSFSEAMVQACTSFGVSAVSDLKSRVQSIKLASQKPSLLYGETVDPVSMSPGTVDEAEDILELMLTQGKYTDSQPANPSTPFSQVPTVPGVDSICSQAKEKPPFKKMSDLSVVKSCDKTVTPEETSITDQQMIQAIEEAEMLYLLEHEDQWFQSEIDECSVKVDGIQTNRTELVEENRVLDVDFKSASGKALFVSQKAINHATTLLSGIEEGIALTDIEDFVPDENDGFRCASGKKVTVSEHALQKAQELLAEETYPTELLSTEPPGLCQGFKTASGLSISVSQEAIDKASKLFVDDDVAVDVLPSKKRKFGDCEEENEVGFATASGKKVKISEEALQKAKRLLEEEGVPSKKMKAESREKETEENVALDELCVELANMEDSGFETASCKKISVSGDSLKKVETLFDEGNSSDEELTSIWKNGSEDAHPLSQGTGLPVTFTTANGNKVDFSESASEKAQNLLADVDSVDDHSNLASHSAKELNSVGRDTEVCSVSSSVGFATASGKKITISDEALEKAKKLFTDEDATVEDIIKLVEKKKNPSLTKATSLDGKSEPEIEPMSDLKGFATASGKKVAVSDSALEKAKKLFAEEDSSVEDITKSITARKNRNRNRRAVLVKSPTGKLEPETIDLMSTEGGFATASGKKVAISSSALEKAKKLFSDEDPSEEDLAKLVAESKKLRSTARSVPNKELKTETCSQLFRESGFATASGKEVTISSSALEKVKTLFADENSPVEALSDLAKEIRSRRKDGVGAKAECLTASGSNVTAFLNTSSGLRRSQLETSSLDDSTPVGFATASGKSVSVSEESLKKAQMLFQEDESVAVFSPTSEKTSSIAHTIGLTKKREVLKRVEKNGFKVPFAVKKNPPRSVVPEKAFHGFLTASGRNVPGSRKALARAKAIFEEIDQGEKLNVSMNVSDGVLPCSLPETSPKKGSVHSVVNGSTRENKVCQSQPIHQSLSPVQPVPVAPQDNCPPNKSLDSSEKEIKTVNKTLSQEILEITAAFIEDETGHSVASPTGPRSTRAALVTSRIEPITSKIEPITSKIEPITLKIEPTTAKIAPFSPIKPMLTHPAEIEDRNNAPEPVSCFPEDFSPIVAPGSPILGDRSKTSRRKIRRKVGGKLSLSTSLVAGKSSTPLVKKDIATNISLPVPSTTESTEPNRTEKDLEKGWEVDEDDEILTNFKLDDVISEVTKAEEERLLSERELRPEVSEARKKAAEDQEKVVKSGITGKKGPKMAMGRLFSMKSNSSNIQRPLKTFVGLEKPGIADRTELLRLGVSQWVLDITSENAVDFRLNAWNYYSADVCLENVFGLPVGDGARLILNDQGTVGIAEVERAFLASASVDPSLVPSGWVRNHYRWIVWKLASLERRFPKQFARVLSPHIVMEQLKYRYDREIDRCERPALRKILEHDDSAARRMVSCVASIKKAEGEAGLPQIELELTDGWYSIFAVIDKELQNRVLKGKVVAGTKLITHGAELLNCPQGCPPLEITSDVRLKITSNSCRRARWDAKLGFQRDPRPFHIPLQSVLANGGMVGCVKVYVARIYPLVYLEKSDKARTVVRTERAERREAVLAEAKTQKTAEELFVQAQAEVQQSQANPAKTKRHVTRQLVAEATSTQELCALMESAIDPVAFENMLSDEQKSMVLALQREKQENLCREVQSKVKQKLQEQSNPQRNVTPILKVRLVDAKNPDSESSAILSIWHPPEDMSSLFKESQLTTMYSLTVNSWRAGVLHLSATRSSQYHQEVEREVTMPPSLTRTLKPFSELYSRKMNPAFGEVDAVGVVVRVDALPQPSTNNETPGRRGSQYQSIYLADHDQNIIGVSFWGGLKEYGVDDIVQVGVPLSIVNLQWRGVSLRGPVCLYAQEVSVFSLNPRQQNSRDAIQALQKLVKPDVKSFVKSCEEKLEDLLLNATPYKMHASTPMDDIRLRHSADSPTLTPKLTDKNVSSPAELRSSTPVHDSPLASSLKEFSPVVQDRLKKLNYYGDAPPLPPIVLAQRRSSLRRGFRPPRRTLDPTDTKVTPSSDANDD